MAEVIALTILTHEGLAIADEAVSVVAPGGRGYVGMLCRHAPMVTTLRAGRLSWRRPDGTAWQARIGSGLLEIVRNRLTVLTSEVSERSGAEAAAVR